MTGITYEYEYEVGEKLIEPDHGVVSGYTFGGWYKDAACTQAWNFEKDTVVNNTTLYAKWIENAVQKAAISGNVTEQDSGVVPDATVELFLGTVKVAATVTDVSGDYSFNNVENGAYNIVVTKDDKTKTELVTVNTVGYFTKDVELPKKSISSVVEVQDTTVENVKSDISQTVVGGLDKIAQNTTVNEGDTVTIKLTVEPKEESRVPSAGEIKQTAGNGKKVEFLDMSLLMQVNNNAPTDIGSNNTQLLTIVIPFDFTDVDVSSVMIIRKHGSGAATKLTRTANSDGEYFTVDEQAGTITLYAMKFSDYALAYEEQTHSGSGSGGGSVRSKPVNPKYKNPFADVTESDYFYDAVLWAAEMGITAGTDATHFDPLNITTRAQMVTFLWRTAGMPEPVSKTCKFTDVKEGSYYYKAVLWAIEQGITKGTSETTFSPDVKVTRAQAVTFLARMTGVKDDASGYMHSFTDVKATAYYNNSVAWASTNKITEGTSTTTFSPDNDCTRGQIVCFLYRYYKQFGVKK